MEVNNSLASDMTSFFAQIFRIFAVPIPFLGGMNAFQFTVGFFIVLLSVKLFHMWFTGDSK